MSQNFKSENKNTFYYAEFLIIVIYFFVFAIFSYFYLTDLLIPANTRYIYYFHFTSLVDIISVSMIGYAIVQFIFFVIVGFLFYKISNKTPTSYLLTKKGIILFFLVAYIAMLVSILVLSIFKTSTSIESNTNLLNVFMQTLLSFALNIFPDNNYSIIRLLFDYLPTLISWYLFSTFINFKRH